MLKIRTIQLLTVAATLLGSSVSMASTTTPLVSKENYTVGQGDLQTLFSMDPELLRGDGHLNSFQLTLGANYFINDIFAPGVEFNFTRVAGQTGAQFLPNLKAYWPLHTRVLPYGQFGLGYAHLAGADLFDLRIGPGVDFLLANNVAVGIQLRYDLGVGDGTFHKIAFPVGFQIYFKL